METKDLSYLKKQGEAIKQLRKQKSLTQAQLSKENESHPNYICAARHLRKIENGEVSPTPDMLNRLLQVLGISVEEFTAQVFGNNLAKFSNEFDRFWDLLYNGNYAEASIQFDILKQADYCDTNSPKISQAMILGEGVFVTRKDDDYQKHLDTFIEALCITAPMVVSKNRIIRTDTVAKTIFSKNEYRLLNIIATTNRKLEYNYAAIEMLKALRSSLCNAEIDITLQKELLPGIYFNLSNMLHRENKHSDVLGFCNDGITFCETNRVFKIIGELYYNKGRALYNLDKSEQAKDSFELSHSTLLSQGDKGEADRIKKVVLDKFQIAI